MASIQSRRRFFYTAAAMAAAPVFSRAAEPTISAAPAGGAAALKLGLASYSMREFTLDQALDMARQMGVRYMTFKDVHVPRTDPPEATRALRDHGRRHHHDSQ